MKSPFRVIGRVLFLLVVVTLLVIGGVLAYFTSWRSDKLAELNEGSEVFKTAWGDVEAVVRGDGPPVLVFHGAPGGYDQALLLARGLDDAGYKVIAPSRPGYLRTPLASGLLPSQQADIMAALLDTLDESKVTLLGVAEGAPAAIEFALKYPNRVSGLVLVSPVLRRWTTWKKEELPPVASGILEGLTGDVGSWIAVEKAKRDPRGLLNAMETMTSTGTEEQHARIVDGVMANPDQLEWFQGLVGSFAPLTPRETGTRNDILQIRNLPDYPYEKIAAPTLLLYGALDPRLPADLVASVTKRIPSVEPAAMPAEGAVVWLGPDGDTVRERLLAFLKKTAQP